MNSPEMIQVGLIIVGAVMHYIYTHYVATKAPTATSPANSASPLMPGTGAPTSANMLGILENLILKVLDQAAPPPPPAPPSTNDQLMQLIHKLVDNATVPTPAPVLPPIPPGAVQSGPAAAPLPQPAAAH